MRLVLKTLSYGTVHIVVATGVAYAITGSWAMALGIGLIEPIVQTGVFALHDYLWERGRPTREKSDYIKCCNIPFFNKGKKDTSDNHTK